MCGTRRTYPPSIQCVPWTAGSEHEKDGIHGSTLIDPFTMGAQGVVGFVLGNERNHSLPDFITYPPYILPQKLSIMLLIDNTYWDRFLIAKCAKNLREALDLDFDAVKPVLKEEYGVTEKQFEKV
ncbi:hypothetical protein IW00_01895 [Pectobacterium brasiliense]|nr:hypothetical protein IW00_01895 [Pectobacterium brasiliense]